MVHCADVFSTKNEIPRQLQCKEIKEVIFFTDFTSCPGPPYLLQHHVLQVALYDFLWRHVPSHGALLHVTLVFPGVRVLPPHLPHRTLRPGNVR
jgi:hypothetical protein